VGRERDLPSYHTWTVMQWAGLGELLVPPFLGKKGKKKKMGAVPIALCGAWELARPRAALVLSQQTVVRTCTAPALGHFLPLGLLLG
jgi:hypothetical protein